METAYKLLTATKPILPIHCGIAPPMKILVNSRLMAARCDDCTNANCILTESWGCGEVKNVVLKSVKTAYKLLRGNKSILLINHGVAPPMEMFANSRLKPPSCDDCTNGNCILTKSWGCAEVINVVLQSVQTACKQRANNVPTSTGHQTHPFNQPRYSAANGIFC